MDNGRLANDQHRPLSTWPSVVGPSETPSSINGMISMHHVLLSLLLVVSEKPALIDLSVGSIELRQAFEKAESDVRLVLLLSPG